MMLIWLAFKLNTRLFNRSGDFIIGPDLSIIHIYLNYRGIEVYELFIFLKWQYFLWDLQPAQVTVDIVNIKKYTLLTVVSSAPWGTDAGAGPIVCPKFYPRRSVLLPIGMFDLAQVMHTHTHTHTHRHIVNLDISVCPPPLSSNSAPLRLST